MKFENFPTNINKTENLDPDLEMKAKEVSSELSMVKQNVESHGGYSALFEKSEKSRLDAKDKFIMGGTVFGAGLAMSPAAMESLSRGDYVSAAIFSVPSVGALTGGSKIIFDGIKSKLEQASFKKWLKKYDKFGLSNFSG